jgi:hypothetical protein
VGPPLQLQALTLKLIHSSHSYLNTVW